MSSRRGFIKSIVTLSGMIVLAGKNVFAEQKRGGGGSAAAGGDSPDLKLPMVEPGKDLAASMNYQQKKSNIKDAKLKAERQGVAWDKQHCGVCMLYTQVGKKGGEEVGKCTLFPGKLVLGNAWCSSWTKKG